MPTIRQSGFRGLRRGLAAMALLASPMALFAQSCPLCYQDAANSGPRFIQALKAGILALLFPPLLIGAVITIMAYRKRNTSADDELFREDGNNTIDSEIYSRDELTAAHEPSAFLPLGTELPGSARLS